MAHNAGEHYRTRLEGFISSQLSAPLPPVRSRAKLSDFRAQVGDGATFRFRCSEAKPRCVKALWVKASGAWLKDALAKNIFVVIDQKQALAQVDQGEPVYRRLDDNAALRPSIETSLHVALPHRIVVHIHAVTVMALAVRQDAEALFNKKLAGLRFAFVPYVKPGWPLTAALRNAIGPSAPYIYVLGNHGLIVAGDTVMEVEALLTDISSRMDAPQRAAPPADKNFLAAACGDKWRLPTSDTVHSLATDPISHAYATGGMLYPDHAVFLGRGCLAVPADELASIDPPKQPMILVNDNGVLFAANLSAGGEAMAECLAAVLARIPLGAKLNYLSARDEDELLNWDAEKYRQTVK